MEGADIDGCWDIGSPLRHFLICRDSSQGEGGTGESVESVLALAEDADPDLT